MQLSHKCRVSVRRRGQLPPRDSTAEARWPLLCEPARSRGAAFSPLERRRRPLAAVGIAKPALSRAADRPLITHGIQSGDVSIDSAIVWARADRPARMLVEVATTDSFKDIRSAVFVDALPETDFTAKALIEGLPAGQDIFYRIRFQDHSFPTLLSEPQIGRFRTAPSERRNVSFVWSGDTAGRAGASTRRAAACAPMPPC